MARSSSGYPVAQGENCEQLVPTINAFKLITDCGRAAGNRVLTARELMSYTGGLGQQKRRRSGGLSLSRFGGGAQNGATLVLPTLLDCT